jgi:hypothetical protein
MHRLTEPWHSLNEEKRRRRVSVDGCLHSPHSRLFALSVASEATKNDVKDNAPESGSETPRSRRHLIPLHPLPRVPLIGMDFGH